MEIKKKYSEIVAIIESNNLYFNYDDSDFDQNGNALRTIIVSRSADVTYVCVIPIKQTPDAGSDQEHFDANLATKAGEKKYVYYSQQFDVDGDGYEFDFKIKAYDEITDVEAFLYKGSVNVNASAVRGDWIEAQVVDKDNVLGYGAGLVLGWVIRKWILSGGSEYHEINPPKYDFLSSKRKIPSGCYIRVIYHGTGTPNIIVSYEYEY